MLTKANQLIEPMRLNRKQTKHLATYRPEDCEPPGAAHDPMIPLALLKIARKQLALAAQATQLRNEETRRECLAWVWEGSNEVLGFRWACDVAGVRPAFIRAALVEGLSDA